MPIREPLPGDFSKTPEQTDAIVEAPEGKLQEQEIEQIGQAWTKYFGIELPDGFESFDVTQLKNFLHDSLRKEYSRLIEDMGIIYPDPKLVDQEDPQSVEQYIAATQRAVHWWRHENSLAVEKSSREGVVPSKIKEAKQFNCYAASFLGNELLEKAGIKGKLGIIPGFQGMHVVDVVRLPENKAEIIADYFHDEPRPVGEESREDFGDYVVVRRTQNDRPRNPIVIAAQENAPGLALGAVLSPEERETVGPILNKLYPAIQRIRQNSEVVDIGERANLAHRFSTFEDEYWQGLSEVERLKIIDEFHAHVDEIIENAENDFFDAPDGFSQKAYGMLDMRAALMARAKNRWPELYKYEKHRLLERLRKLKKERGKE